MLKYLVLILTLFSFTIVSAQDSLTLKQRLTRVEKDLNDLMKGFYGNSRANSLTLNQSKQDVDISSNLSALDMRLYDLEKKLKQLNDELISQLFDEIDDLNISNQKISRDLSELSKKILNLQDPNSQNKELFDQKTIEKNINTDTNNLGKLILKTKDLSDDKDINKTDKKIGKVLELTNEKKLNSKEEFQIAYDLIRGQEWESAISALKKFIKNNPDDILSGSAHYWIGKIYLMKKNYAESAIILTEGYQKHSKSQKAPEMLDLLSEALVFIDKKNEACEILKIFIREFSNNPISSKIENRILSLNCPPNT